MYNTYLRRPLNFTYITVNHSKPVHGAALVTCGLLEEIQTMKIVT